MTKMKTIKIILFAIVFFIIGYIVGNISPLAFFQFLGSVVGDTKLRVTVLKDDNIPVQNLEVDIGLKLGPPPRGGVAITDQKGEAIFYLKPGKYFIFFNAANFPKDLEYPSPRAIEIKEGEVNQQTIYLKSK